MLNNIFLQKKNIFGKGKEVCMKQKYQKNYEESNENAIPKELRVHFRIAIKGT